MTLIYHGRLFFLLYWMFVFTSSYIFTSSIDILCITTIHMKAILIRMVMIYRLLVFTLDSDISWHIVCPSLWDIWIHFLFYIPIFNWYFMHHYHTSQGHINKHGYDSQASFLVITIKIANSPYIWLLYIMANCLSFLMKGLCSLSLKCIHLWLPFYASIP